MIMVPVENIKRKLQSEFHFLSEARIRVVPSAVDIEKIRPEHQKNKIRHNVKCPNIGVFSRKLNSENIKNLVRIFDEVRKHFPLAIVNVISEDDGDVKLNGLMRKRNAKHFINILGRSKFHESYRKWDVCLDLSGDHEHTVMAMRAGIPVVAMKEPAIIEGISHNMYKARVENNPKNAAKKIIEILRNPSLAARLKREEIEHSKQFSYNNIASIIEKEYINLLKEK
jgi:glycosyltransferase involved in cell wall biosynthesis